MSLVGQSATAISTVRYKKQLFGFLIQVKLCLINSIIINLI